MRNKYMAIPWAFAGDVTLVPDPTNSDGTVSYNQGWGPDYQRDQTTDALAKDISRANMNSVLNQITTLLQEWQQETFPEFISTADNSGAAFAYDIGTVVRYRATTSDPFINYRSLVVANSAIPTSSLNWIPIRPEGYRAVTASRTLVASDINTLLTIPSVITLTLPTPSSLGVAIGESFTVVANSSGQATVAPGSGASINYDAVGISNLVIKSGQSATFVAIGVAPTAPVTWQVVNSTAGMERNADFVSIAGSNGYERSPGGRIHMWATAVIPNNGSITWPFPWPISPDSILANVAGGAAWGAAGSTNSAVVIGHNASGSQSVVVHGWGK